MNLTTCTQAQFIKELRHRVADGRIDLYLRQPENKPGKLLLRVEDAHDDHRAGWYLPTPIVSTTPTPTPTEEGPTA